MVDYGTSQLVAFLNLNAMSSASDISEAVLRNETLPLVARPGVRDKGQNVNQGLLLQLYNSPSSNTTTSPSGSARRISLAATSLDAFTAATGHVSPGRIG